MSAEAKVLITGSSGFIGRRAVATMLDSGCQVRAVTRDLRAVDPTSPNPNLQSIAVGGLGAATDWRAALHDIDTVVHLAGRAHVMRERPADAQRENFQVNYAGTVRLAEDAERAGIGRFVFVSTSKVFGELSAPGRPFAPNDGLAPAGPYATSKALAEEHLRRIFDRSSTELVIVRPPLVYGPSVRGNFRRLIQIADTPIPLPFGTTGNRRSMIYVDNLASFLLRAVSTPKLNGHVLLPADADSYTVGSIVTAIREALGRPARLIGMPHPLTSALETRGSRHAVVSRVLGNFELETRGTNALLNWHPPIDLNSAIERTIQLDQH